MAYNRQQFFRMIEGLRGFRSLVAILDVEGAESVAGLLFEAQVRETNPEGRYIELPPDKQERYPARVDWLLHRECDQIRAKRAYVMELLEDAQAGRLHARLTERTEPETVYAPARRIRGSRPDGEIAKAAGWVGRSLHGDGYPVAAEILARYVLDTSSDPALGRTPSLLDRIHAEIAADAPPARRPNEETTYPSSVGGRYLLELVFELTADTRWPPPGHVGWIDAALFYLAAVTTVQGYSDGNKRIGRMAYAITLLKGGRAFVAPNEDYEAELIRMTDPEPTSAR